MKNIEFYQEVAGLIRRDIVKQKYLLPPENLAGLCAEHHRMTKQQQLGSCITKHDLKLFICQYNIKTSHSCNHAS